MRMDHEGLDVHKLAVEMARAVGRLRCPPGLRHVHEQGHRAAASVVLNVAEGWGLGGTERRRYLRVARGSAAEVLAVLDLLDCPEGPELQQKLRRIDRMLRAMGG